MHVDKNDGSLKLPLVYLSYNYNTDHPCCDSESPSQHNLRSSDLVVTEHANGGRAVRVSVSNPNFITIILFNASLQAHGNVWPDECVGVGRRRLSLREGAVLLRLIPYTKKQCIEFVAEILKVKSQGERMRLWSEIATFYFDSHLQNESPPFAILMRTRSMKGGEHHNMDT